jgi:hypothetical protein
MEIQRSGRNFYTSPITTIRNGNPEKWPEFLYFPYNGYPEWKSGEVAGISILPL